MMRSVAATVYFGAMLFVASPLIAQESETPGSVKAARPDDKVAPAIALEQVEAALKSLESENQLDDAIKGPVRSRYQRAVEQLREAQRFEAQTAEYRKTLEAAPERTVEIRDQLQALLDTDSSRAAQSTTDPLDLQRELDLQRIKLSELTDELAQSVKERRDFDRRPVEISARIPEIERQLRELRRELSSPELASDATSPRHIAERTLIQAQQSRLKSEGETLEQELISLSVREDLHEVEQKLLQRQLELLTDTVEALNNLLHGRLGQLASETRTRVDSLSAALPAGNTDANALAVEVQELALEFETVVERQDSVPNALSRVSALLRTLEEDYANLQELRELGGSGTSTVPMLHRLQRRALRANVDEQTRDFPALDEVQLASAQIREKLSVQTDTEQKFDASSTEATAQLVSLRRDLLENLQKQYGNRLRATAELIRRRREYFDRAGEIRSDILEQLLAFEIRSSAPLSIKSLTEVPQGLVWVFSSDHLSAFGSALARFVTHRPVMALGLVLIATVILIGRPWIRGSLVRCGSEMTKISTDRFSLTLKAVVWTILLAAPLPLLLVFAHGVTLYAAENSDWMFGLGEGLWRASRLASFAAVTVAVCYPGGLGAVHFGWSDRGLVTLRSVIRRLVVVYLTAIVLTSVCAAGESSQYFGSVGLFSFLLAHIWSAFVLWQAYRALDRMVDASADQQQRRFAVLQRSGLLALLSCLVALNIAACLGYLVTANHLSQGLVWTLARISGGVGLYFLTLRWFSIRQRRLMLADAVERRRARQQAAEQHEQQEELGEIVSVDLEDQQGIDLQVVSEQLRNLLRLLFGLGVAVVVILFWTQVYPLADVLDSVPIPLGESFTLLELIKAVLITVVTILMVRMLPGLLELTFLRARTTDSGTRHAIYTLGQYVVIAIGFVMVVNAVQLDWAQLSWIATGLSVGLGFGLQEVVANFVCGLILLFERPIRVGDVVTVNETTGTVTRINIRATTITNWDRKDFVVPNKNLITGTILNWTLTASINRVVVSVGVAYDTDTEQAQQVLLDVAADHPRILDDPAPISSFDQFGDSSLNLVLYAYLPDLDFRIRTITELHTEIKKRFAAAGIEIPFPQRDVNFRNAEAETAVGYKAEDGQSRS